MTTVIASSPSHRLTVSRVVIAQLRLFLGGATARWGLLAVLMLAIVVGVVAGLIGLPVGVEVEMLPLLTLVMILAAVGVHLFAIAVGSDAIAGEFTRGTIRAALAIVPQRGLYFAAHALTACAAVFVVGIFTGLAAGGSMLGCAVLLDHTVTRQVFVAWLLATVGLAVGAAILAVLTVAIGALARQRLVAVLVPIIILYLLPLAVAYLGGSAWVFATLPSTALTALTMTGGQGETTIVADMLSGGAELSTWGGLLVLGIWCAVLVPIAVVVFLRRNITVGSTYRGRQRIRLPKRDTATARRMRPVGVSFSRLIASEWRKAWSLPSVRWIFFLATLVLLASGIARAGFGAVGLHKLTALNVFYEYSYSVTDGIDDAVLLLAVFAAIHIAGEFHTGTAATTFSAARRRWHITGAKLITTALMSITITIPGMLITAPVALALYAARGFPPTSEIMTTAALSVVRSLLFVLLMAAMSAGIAGAARRGVATVLTVAVLFVIGPALLNAAGGLARAIGSPLASAGNLAYFLPWAGERFYGPGGLNRPFAEVDEMGVLHISPEFGITVTAVWALLAVIAWFIVDVRRPIVIR